MNKNVLITGASKGVGRALATKMSAEGHIVTGLARNFGDDSILRHQIQLDLSDLPSLADQMASNPLFEQDFDVVVFNAGFGQFGGLEQFSYEQISNLVNVNLVGNLYMLKHLLPTMNARGNKDIVFLGSEAGLAGAKQGAVYCATKFAIRGLAQSLRADMAKNGGRVILVNPGPTDSEFFDDLNFKPKEGDDYSLNVDVLADAIINALNQPRNTVLEEINIQPLKRVFEKK